MKRKKSEVAKSSFKKIIFTTLVIIIAYFLMVIFKNQIISLLSKSQIFLSVYIKIYYEYASRNIFSFALIAFLGSLFFILIPTELVFIAYLMANINPILLIILVLSSIAPGHIIDYYVGRYFAFNIKQYEKKGKYKDKISKLREYGYYIIFFFNFIPGPAPIFSFLAGMLKFKFRKVMAYVFVPQMLKYSLITVTYIFILRFS